MTDHNATVPIRRVRHSREFMSHAQLTPALARLHDLPTLRQHTPVIDEPPSRERQTTGRLEDKLFRKVKRQHARSWLLGVAVSVALGLLGLGVGYLFAAVVAAAGRV